MFNSETTTVPRITNGYCEGSHKKKLGFSEILRDEELPKSDSACLIQTYAWKARIYAERCIQLMPVDDPKAKHFLEWFCKNNFAIGAYAFNKGNTNHRVFPDTCLDDIESEIKRMKVAIKTETNRPATDFIRQTTEYGLQVEEFQVQVRELETGFVSWMYDVRVVSDFYSHLEKDSESGLVRFNRMVLMAKFLNRLSTWVYWLNQYHDMLLQKDMGKLYSFVEWQAKKEIEPLFPVA